MYLIRLMKEKGRAKEVTRTGTLCEFRGFSNDAMLTKLLFGLKDKNLGSIRGVGRSKCYLRIHLSLSSLKKTNWVGRLI